MRRRRRRRKRRRRRRRRRRSRRRKIKRSLQKEVPTTKISLIHSQHFRFIHCLLIFLCCCYRGAFFPRFFTSQRRVVSLPSLKRMMDGVSHRAKGIGVQVSLFYPLFRRKRIRMRFYFKNSLNPLNYANEFGR